MFKDIVCTNTCEEIIWDGSEKAEKLNFGMEVTLRTPSDLMMTANFPYPHIVNSSVVDLHAAIFWLTTNWTNVLWYI